MSLGTVSLGIEYFPDPTKGRPVFNGSVFVGDPDTDPEIEGNQKQITLKQEDGTLVQVSQPVTTGAGGVVLYQGSPVQVLVDGNYSVKVLNKQGAQVYFIDNFFEGAPLVSNDGQYNVPFDTIADMVADLSLKLDNTVVLQDYATGRESGVIFGKVVAEATGTANAFTFIDLPNTTPPLQFQQNLPDIVSIRLAGADKSGVTDSAPAMTAVRDSGRTAYFPGVDVAAGEFYKMEDSVNPLEGQAFIGDGFNSYCKFTPATAIPDGQLMGFVGASAGDLHIGGLIYGLHLDTGGVFNMNGIGVTKAKGTVVDNCYFTNIGRKAWTAQNDVFQNKFLNSHIISASQEPASIRVSISIEGQTASDDSSGNIVDNITIEDGGFTAIGITDSKNNIVSNIHILTAVTSRILFLVGTADNDCEGNQLNNITSDAGSDIGIELSRANNNSFTDIDLAPSGTQGITFNITCPNNNFTRVKVNNLAGDGVKWNSTLSTGNKFFDCNITATLDGFDSNAESTRIVGGVVSADRCMNITANNCTIEDVDIDPATTGVNLNGALTGCIINKNRFLAGGTSILLFSTAVDNVITNNVSSSGTPFTGNSAAQKAFSGNSFNFRNGSAVSIPTSGTFTAGDFVENTGSSSFTPDGNNMLLRGWKRAVTGSAHVLNTDWFENYLSTVSPASP